MLPASAGMILCRLFIRFNMSSAPRIRGDDPVLYHYLDTLRKCSLHPRG